MTGREFDQLIRRHFLHRLSGYACGRGLLFKSPLRYLLRGFCFQPSSFDKFRFSVQLFVQPLFVSSDHIYFSIGNRLGELSRNQERWWSVAEESENTVMEDVFSLIMSEGPLVFDRFSSLRDVCERVVAHNPNKHDLYAPEMAAYAAVLLDDCKAANEMFDCAEKRIAMGDDRRDWVLQLIDRIRTMRKTYDRSPQEAKSLLHHWRDETAANLKLSEFIDDSVSP